MKVSIQGVKGAFHEAAARDYFSEPISIVENLTFESLIRSVENGVADAAVMAIENTISGTIHKNYQLLINSNVHIVGEVYLRIVQNLAVNKGVRLKDLKAVESHYMAINQCRRFFENYPKIQLIESDDTALSMKKVAENNLSHTGAIGSKLAAAHYGLNIIGEGIETNKKNYTRFLVLEKGGVGKGNNYPKADKASIQFVLKNKKGALAKILALIDANNIDLSKIESLPLVGEPWHYQFFLDILYEKEMDFEKMLDNILGELESLMILGKYINTSGKINL